MYLTQVDKWYGMQLTTHFDINGKIQMISNKALNSISKMQKCGSDILS